MERFILPASVDTIGTNAFTGAGLTEITLPDTVKTLKTVEIAEKAHEMMAQNLGPALLAD